MKNPTDRREKYIDAALEGEFERVANAPEGQRNEALFKGTAALAGLVDAGLDEQIIRQRMIDAAEKNGLVRGDGLPSVLKTIDSGVRAGMSNPRDILDNDSEPVHPRLDARPREHTAALPAEIAIPVKYPVWSPADGGEQPSYACGDQEPYRHGDEVARYVYRRAGEPIRVKIKSMKGDKKTFSNWYKITCADGEIGWQGRKPIGFQEVPFIGTCDPFAPALASAKLWWPEGEKDTDTLAKGNLAAFTFGGTSDLPAGCEQYVVGRDVIICADNDDAGREHAEKKAWLCSRPAKSVRILHFPGTKTGGDVSDWLAAGHTEIELIKMANETPPWEPTIISAIPAISASADESWEEPDWNILHSRRGDLPEFPIHALPPEWQEWLVRSAHGAGVTPDHVIVPLFAIASSLIGTARRIRPARAWSEPLTMWTALVGDSGTGKTPGLNVTKRALSWIERDREGQLAAMRRAHETKAEAAKAAETVWKQAVKEATDGERPTPIKPPEATSPGEFVEPRLYISNATIERIAVLLQSRPSGMLVIADELSGLFLNMARYSSGQDNEFWLESYNGERYVVERMGRPALIIPHLLVGITGGFQPDKLSASLKGDHDGMYARLCFGWPAEPKYKRLTDESAEVEPEIVNALARLIQLSAGDEDEFVPRHTDLSLDARELFEEFRGFLNLGKHGLEGRDRHWWAKGASHVLRLAGTLAYLECSMRGDPEPSQIEHQHIESATLIWKEYFLPHSMAAVRCIGVSEQHSDERRILRSILARNMREISIQDIRRDVLAQRLNAAETEQIVQRLSRSGWLREIAMVKGSGPGRPQRRWLVNPKLFEKGHAGIAENAEIDKAG
jgi:hypothetical protein